MALQRASWCQVLGDRRAQLGCDTQFFGLISGDGEDGPRAAPVDGVSEDKDTHRTSPLTCQGGSMLVTWCPALFVLSPGMILRILWVPPLHPSMFVAEGDAQVPLDRCRMWHRTAHQALSPIPLQGHLGDGRSTVVCHGCSQMPGTK